MKKHLMMLVATLLFSCMGVAMAVGETPQQEDSTPAPQATSADDDADCSDS